jgi:hypothetical protein
MTEKTLYFRIMQIAQLDKSRKDIFKEINRLCHITCRRLELSVKNVQLPHRGVG